MAGRITVSDIASRKGATPIVVLTCYTATMARILDEHVDVLLVGDSMGMVVYGMKGTNGVTLDTMIAHGKAVTGATSRAMVIMDLPAGSYEASPEQALLSSCRVMAETGADAVKLEGGVDRAAIIAHLVANKIPVVGHVGLLPQRVTSPDGFRYQGRTPEDAARIMADALAVERAGAFAVVIEAVAETVAREITARLRIPTIGIGASPACDGQVLVTEDMLGLTGRTPSFVKHYANLADTVGQAVKHYANEVKSRAFPSAEYYFTGKKK